MHKNVITISRQFGSGGRTIGRELANRLNIPFYDKELVEKVALESGFAPTFLIAPSESPQPIKKSVRLRAFLDATTIAPVTPDGMFI